MLTQIDPITRLRDTLAPVRHRLQNHPLYREVKTLHHLQIFMESHVFAVWDFMSLLKSLQAGITCVTTPWLPSRYPQSRRLINEIVLGQESDTYGTTTISHFELYLKAMAESQAGTFAIDTLIEQLADGKPLAEAMQRAAPPPEAAAFVQTTFSLLQQDQLHITAAAFTFGREDLIPEMFQNLVRDLRTTLQKVDLFDYYLTATSRWTATATARWRCEMLEDLCGYDDRKWEEAASAAEKAIEARIALWDGILQRMRTGR